MKNGRYLLGLDIGSSSVKASILDIDTGQAAGAASSPDHELEIIAPRPGWAEQRPDTWWEHAIAATGRAAAASGISLTGVEAVGISYQMHGLVLVDKNVKPLRNAIIWCDSRAVETGDRAFNALGRERCLTHLLNSPGNFTASKLKWVKDNEPELFGRAWKMMLPGDYLAWLLTGEVTTTCSGLSEAVLWDFPGSRTAAFLLEHYGIPAGMLPPLVPAFGVQGRLTGAASASLGVRAGIPVSYRAGDQPNNAYALNVLDPGEIAATAGTSGVVYGVLDRPRFDPDSRVNTFVHVNHTDGSPRYGMLLCVNGAGILNSWVRHNGGGAAGLAYDEMNRLAATAPAGCDGLSLLPFGNGAERTLGNAAPGCSVHNLQFTRHTRAHLYRAAQEGIVFALAAGMGIMRKAGCSVSKVRAGNANMFLSPVFCEAFAGTTGTVVELFSTDGAQGAARGAGAGAGIFATREDAFAGLKCVRTITPDPALAGRYAEAFSRWRAALTATLDNRGASS